jgi:predicted short-subunit dehydrogenase-like oxidoreductase (DUF2520 family)
VKKPTIAVIGSGRAAGAIVAHAEHAGFAAVRVAARSFAHAKRAATRRGLRGGAPRKGIRAVRSFGDAVRGAAYVILAVSDGAIETVARRLAAEVPEGWKGKTVLHLSGALGPEPLAALGRRGATVGAIHPLTVFAAEPSVLGARWFRLDGTEAFRRSARALAHALFVAPRELRTKRPLDADGRARYHAAAALVANDLASLIQDGVTLFRSIGVPRTSAQEALADLAEDAAFAMFLSGPRRGLTGPVVRGDADTVRRHLEALREVDPEIAEIHRLLSLRLVRIAVEAKRISAPQAAALRKVLRPTAGGPPGPRGV